MKRARATRYLFIDEIHTVIGAGATSGGAMDASNLLKPALQSGTLRCIGSTTYKEYRQHFEKDRALARRFQKIDVNEPTVEDAGQDPARPEALLRALPRVRYTGEAIRTAVELSARYIGDRKLPDKAIDVIDEVGAGQMLLVPEKPSARRPSASEGGRGRGRQDRPHPGQIASRKSDTEAVLKTLEAHDLKRVVFGQDRPSNRLSAAIKLARAGLREPEQAHRLLSVLRPDRRRQDRGGQASSPPPWASRCSASTCPNIWSGTRSAG